MTRPCTGEPVGTFPDGQPSFPDGESPFPDGQPSFPGGELSFPDGELPFPGGELSFPDGIVASWIARLRPSGRQLVMPRGAL